MAQIDEMVSKDGGACGMRGAAVDALTTAQVLTLASRKAVVADVLGERIESSIQYLWQSQRGDGHWERPNDGWHSSITSWVLQALTSWENTEHRDLERSIHWLLDRALPQGGIAESQDVIEPNTYATANAISAWHLARVGARQIDENLGWLRGRQHPSGGFQDACVVQNAPEASISAYVWHGIEGVNTSLAIQIKHDVERFLPAAQRSSGAWTTWYDDADTVEGTASALRVLIGSESRNAHSINKGLEFLLRAEWPTDEWWIMSSLAYLIDTCPDFS